MSSLLLPTHITGLESNRGGASWPVAPVPPLSGGKVFLGAIP